MHDVRFEGLEHPRTISHGRFPSQRSMVDKVDAGAILIPRFWYNIQNEHDAAASSIRKLLTSKIDGIGDELK